MSNKGYRKLLIADGLKNVEAKVLKSQIEMVCKKLGYEKTRREQLYPRAQ